MTKQDCQRERAINANVEGNARRYQRKIHLPRLISVSHCDMDNLNHKQMRDIVTRLHHALRQERRRGGQGHWAYNLNRHLGLMAAYKQELKACDALTSGEVMTKTTQTDARQAVSI